MLIRKFRLYSVGRSVALVTVAALALTAIEPSMAFAGAAPAAKRAAVAAYQGPTDVSARRKAVRYRGGGANGAAAAAAFAGIIGTGLAIAAARSNYDDYGYYGGPGYYAGPGYYGGGAPYYYGGYGGYRSGVPYYRGHPLAGW